VAKRSDCRPALDAALHAGKGGQMEDDFHALDRPPHAALELQGRLDAHTHDFADEARAPPFAAPALYQRKLYGTSGSYICGPASRRRSCLDGDFAELDAAFVEGLGELSMASAVPSPSVSLGPHN